MKSNGQKVLMVVTSHDQLGNTGEKTGFWLEELSAPYYVLEDAGLEVEIASIRGGKAPFDPRSLDREGNRPASVTRFLEDKDAMRKIETTKPVDAVDSSDYSAVFLVGGHGTMWDFPSSRKLNAVVGEVFDRGDIVAAVCHGPAGLVSAKRSDGKPIIANKKVTAFTNAEEDAVKLTKVVPFALETRLREVGARFESRPVWSAHAVRDGNLITGQNPASSALVAKHVVEAVVSRG